MKWVWLFHGGKPTWGIPFCRDSSVLCPEHLVVHQMYTSRIHGWKTCYKVDKIYAHRHSNFQIIDFVTLQQVNTGLA